MRVAQEQDIQSQKEGIAYEAGNTMKNLIKSARQSVPNEQRNPKGTDKKQ